MKIGILGTGTISSAVVHGLAGAGHQIVVSERNADKARELDDLYSEVSVAPNQSVLDQSDVVFLGLMASVAEEILPSLTFRPEHRVVSLMAGMSPLQIATLVAPAAAEAVMIPFPGIAQGGSPVMLRGNQGLVEELFGQTNQIFVLNSDEELDAYMCAQAVLSPAVRMVHDAAGWLGDRVKNPQQAEAFLRMLVGSSLSGSETSALLKALDTPGGYNARLREHMVSAGMTDDLTDGLNKLAQ
ncbi:MAG: pyrroline-5-carboxylate reductase [Rhodobacteraceae bacterium]|nr:pyrroline-5-carboxylate reductase [Paracoccaceae bacterium]